MNRCKYAVLLAVIAVFVCILAACGAPPKQYEKTESGLICYKTTDEGQLSLEVLYPTNRVSRKNPTVIVIYGGGWISGSREDFLREFEPLCDALRADGVTVVAIDYRHAVNEVNCRDSLDDCIDALEFLIGSAGRFDIDKNRIGIIGYSAGAQLAMMTAIEKEDSVSFCVSLSGPTVLPVSKGSDFFSDALMYYSERAFEGMDSIDISSISPVARLNRRCKTEFMLVNGDADQVILPAHANRFKSEAQSLKMDAELMLVPGLTHSYSSYGGFEDLCAEISERIVKALQK